jgi:hypothetical protein
VEGCRHENCTLFRPSSLILSEISSQAVGFEILYQESKSTITTINTSSEGLQSSVCLMSVYFSILTLSIQFEAISDALRRSPEYQKYIQNLTSLGYFRGELEGSQLWYELEKKAMNTYIEVRKEE